MEIFRQRCVAVIVMSVALGLAAGIAVFTPLVESSLALLAQNIYKGLVDQALKHQKECGAECLTIAWQNTYGWLAKWRDGRDSLIVSLVLCFTLFLVALRRLVWLYSRFVREAAEEGVKKPSFLLFLLAKDMDCWLAQQVEALIRQERLHTRKMSESLRSRRLAERRGRHVSGGVQSTGQYEIRSRKIEELCADLLRITPEFPPDFMAESQRITQEARNLFKNGEFGKARELLVAACGTRRELNRQQKVVAQ
ncbi:MAG: hypothetical protein JNN11_01740 [Candidatus Doudnabacteria bacterium]|nr:hypothetical protein [Candidatus Doudnabacteria bacterium]